LEKIIGEKSTSQMMARGEGAEEIFEETDLIGGLAPTRTNLSRQPLYYRWQEGVEVFFYLRK
jgi:hypothetical protein